MLNRGTREGIESEWEDGFISALHKLDPDVSKEVKSWKLITSFMKQGRTPADAAALYLLHVQELRKTYPDKIMYNEAFKTNGWYRYYFDIGYQFAGRWANDSTEEAV